MNRTKFLLGALMGVTVLGAGVLMFKGTENSEAATATGAAQASAPVLKAAGSRPGNAATPGASAYVAVHHAPAGSGDDASPAATGDDSMSVPTIVGEELPPAEPVTGSTGDPGASPVSHESGAPAAEQESPEAGPLEEPLPGPGQQSPEVAQETPGQGKPVNVAGTIDVEKCKVVKCVQQPTLDLANAPFDVCAILPCPHAGNDGQGSGGDYGPVRVKDRDDEPSKPVIKAPILTGILWRRN